MPTYTDYETKTLAPPWLRGPWATKLLGVLGGAKDYIVAAAKDAVKARFVAQAPVDALPYIGQERSIERYPVDTDDTYRARLADGWNVWEFAGTTSVIARMLLAAGFTGVVLFYNTFAAPSWWIPAWPPNGSADYPNSGWSRFWVELNPPFPFPWTTRRWGSGGTTWGDGATWGSTATPAQVAFTKAIIRKWRPASERCAGIFVRLVDDGFGAVDLDWPGT